MGNPEQRVIHSSEDPNWQTPRALFDKLHAEVGFTIDLAATKETALVRGYDPEEAGQYGVYLGPDHPDPRFQNALTTDWAGHFGNGPGWLNMPYSKKRFNETKDPAYDIAEWVRKAFNESERGFTTWCLPPFSPQTEWWRYFVMGHAATGGWRGHAALEIRRFPYRVQFDPSPEYLATMQADHAAGRRKSAQVSSAGHNVALVKFGPNPGFVGPWGPTERYWSYR